MGEGKENLYFNVLQYSIPRAINMLNIDSFSEEYGNTDRDFWAWKTKDFPDATRWGILYSISIAIKKGLLREEFVDKIVDSAITNIYKHLDRYGSLSEAYPEEHSFATNAIVLCYVTKSLLIVKGLNFSFNQKKFKDYAEKLYPLKEFLEKHTEEHGIISNHLATASASILMWNKLTGDKSERWKYFLDIILENQSKEDGFYKEYEGPDPGYQTLCINYLFMVYEETKIPEIKESLEKAGKFLLNFIHPDGTIGGLYGSRNTEVYYPGGIVGLARYIKEYALAAKYLEPSDPVFSQHILPHHIDPGNFAPLLCSYTLAAEEYEKNRKFIDKVDGTPPYSDEKEAILKDAGIFIKSTKKYYAIVNFKKGGVIKAFDKKTGKVILDDGGIFGKTQDGRKFSNQLWCDENEVKIEKKKIEKKNSKKNKKRETEVEIKSYLYEVNEDYLTPEKMIIIRILSVSVFRWSRWIGEIFKKLAVKHLITRKKKIGGYAIRRITFSEDKISISDNVFSDEVKWWRAMHAKAIHMASSGYILPGRFLNIPRKITPQKITSRKLQES